MDLSVIARGPAAVKLYPSCSNQGSQGYNALSKKAAAPNDTAEKPRAQVIAGSQY